MDALIDADLLSDLLLAVAETGVDRRERARVMGSWMSRVAARWGARRVDWIDQGGVGWTVRAERDGTTELRELGGGVRELEPSVLRACPLDAALALPPERCGEARWVARTTAGTSLVLHFSSAPARAFAAEELSTSARWLDLASRARRGLADASEVRLATTLHDLRHVFTLMRWAATDDAGRTSAEAILRDALTDAERVCERGLAGEAVALGERIDVAAVARKATSAAELAARSNRGTTVAVEAERDLNVVTDGTALARLLRNLVVNAIECSRSGSSVRVRCAHSPENGVQIEIADEGPGTLTLPAATSALSGRAGARGIGLTSVVAAATEIGARLTVAGQIGRGSIVTVHVPPLNVPRSIVLAPRSHARERIHAELLARGERAAVVDDGVSALRMASRSACPTFVVSPAAVARDARALWRELARQRLRVRLKTLASA